MAGDIVVDSLIRFASKAEIQGWWQQCLQAHISGSTAEIQLSSTSFEGGTATGVVIKPADRERFMRHCQAALADLEDDEQSAVGYGHHIYFGSRRIES